jgi:hypothetical protein
LGNFSSSAALTHEEESKSHGMSTMINTTNLQFGALQIVKGTRPQIENAGQYLEMRNIPYKVVNLKYQHLDNKTGYADTIKSVALVTGEQDMATFEERVDKALAQELPPPKGYAIDSNALKGLGEQKLPEQDMKWVKADDLAAYVEQIGELLNTKTTALMQALFGDRWEPLDLSDRQAFRKIDVRDNQLSLLFQEPQGTA